MIKRNKIGALSMTLFAALFALCTTIVSDNFGNNAVFAAESVLQAEVNIADADATAAATAEEMSGNGHEEAIDSSARMSSIEHDDYMSRAVIVGGHSIGILLQTDGATVVGFAPVVDKAGQSTSPAEEAGLQVGDFITSINSEAVKTDEELAAEIDRLGRDGKAVILTVERGDKALEIEVQPKLCADSGTWRVGLFIRDNTAGVGTLTFYEPVSRTYGALGHMVTNIESGHTKADEIGTLLNASIQEVKKGECGQPGEKVGNFVEGSISGSISRNSAYGVFGSLTDEISNPIYPEALPLAKLEEVETGPATILTVIDGETIAEYDIEIQKLIPEERDSGKGMIIKVTDAELLGKTGGIIQGMSGSPIVQNGKLVGAVTHVLVNDPTGGFACFVEWMVDEITI